MNLGLSLALTRLSRTGGGAPPSPFDPDALAYITAVEAADGQALEPGVRTAINDFVVGCKSDGIWNAIRASCIMAGARTLSGALVPLVGPAPTNFNFVGADYNRRTGLKGDGTTKYLNSNRNNNADPQNDAHAVVHVTAAHSAVSNSTYLGVGIGFPGVTHVGVAKSGANDLFFRARTNASSSFVGSGNTTGFMGVSRGAAASFSVRVAGQTTTATIASEAPFNGNLLVFGRVVGQPYVNGRMAFYSIGENLNLAQLDARTTALMTAIDGAIP
jgi:hypothetical protein